MKKSGGSSDETELNEEREATVFSMPEKTVIIGSKGRMGKMLLEKAELNGIRAEGHDVPLEDDSLKKTLKDALLVILCVPVNAFSDVLKKIIPHLQPNAVLSDITSVKEKPMRLMESSWTGSIVGTHPLFGPKVGKDDDLPVAIVPGKNCGESAISLVEKFFVLLGCRVFRCGAVEHDHAMARIQNMNFITNLAYFALLSGQDDLLPFLTPSFERRKNAAAKMLNEDAPMFAGLFDANAHSHEAVRQFRKMLNVAAAGDIDLLCRRAQWWWRKNEKNNQK